MAVGGLLLFTPGTANGQTGGSDGTTTTTAAEGGTGLVRGTIRNPDDNNSPIVGAVIVASTADGDEVGTAETDENGKWEIELPEAGDYVFVLDPDSLPDGVELRSEEAGTRALTVRAGEAKGALFPLGTGERDTVSGIDKFLQLMVEGIKFGLVIAMGAIGLSLIFGTTGLTNFSHGEMVTFGALVAWFINVQVGLPLIPAAVLAMLVCGIFAALYDRLFWRPLRKRGTGLIAMLVISLGMAIVFRFLFQYIYDSRRRPFGDYAVQRAVEFGPVEIAPKDIYSIIIAVIVLIGVGLLLQRTRIGKAMRAVADNRDLAESSGIDVDRVILVVWFTGGALACLGGVMFGVTEQVKYDMGFRLLLLMFAGVTLGGLGTAYGALVGSLIIGIVIQVSTLWVPTELKNVGALFLLILILLVRPQGILGQAERVG
jgi:branched-chain amino acid transport system permease protein